MDIKLILAIISTIIGAIGLTHYIVDIFKGKTRPHMYSWLIWGLFQAVGALAIIYGKGGWGALAIGLGSIVCLFIFFISFKYGTKNITIFDTICLISAVIAIGIWVFMKDPLYSVILITIIDFIGFIPTYRKSWHEPHTETVTVFALSAVSGLLDLFAIATYSVTTTLYVATLLTTNLICVLIIVSRKSVLKSISERSQNSSQ